ncbi:carboxyl transferase domain-containing protein [Bradyrhizobium sp. JR3.5]
MAFVSGYCFGSTAAMLGYCEVNIGTRNTSIGIARPAMIEDGCVRIYHHAEVVRISFLSPNGVNVLVEGERQGTCTRAETHIVFRGPERGMKNGDQRLLRSSIPENLLSVYDFRAGIDVITDEDPMVELHHDVGLGMSSALVRIECKPFGSIPNKPRHLGVTIDFALRGKAARFLQLWDAFDLPIVSLCGTFGFMVGTEAEKAAVVRHMSCILASGVSLLVALAGIVLCKGRGLRTQSGIGSDFHAFFAAPQRTGKFGGMELQSLLAARRPPADGVRRRPRAQRTLIEKRRGPVCERQASYRLRRCLRSKSLTISRRQDFGSLRLCDMSERQHLAPIATPMYLCMESSAALRCRRAGSRDK